MAKEIIMPKMGNTVESVILGEVHIKIGDLINLGDLLFDYETDKSTTEFKSEDSGEVLAILFEEGDEVPVLAPVIIVGKKGEDISQWLNRTEEKAQVAEENNSSNKQANEDLIIKNSDNKKSPSNLLELHLDGKNYSPRATKIANSLNVNLADIQTSSGANNRVIERDIIEEYYRHEAKGLLKVETKSDQSVVEFVRVPYTATRNAISKAMEGSLQHGAQLTLMAPFDASEILRLRAIIKEQSAKNPKIQNSSINDIIIFALSRTLPKFPEVNSTINQDQSYNAYNVAHIAVAVDTPKGLFVPVIMNASYLSLNEITLKSKELITKTRNAKLSPNEQRGGTVTITNLGLSGVSAFTPILNPPQSSIIGVGSPIKRLKLVGSKDLQEYSEITISMTMDHRPYDGAKGAEYLQYLIKTLENIFSLFIFENS